jgi:PAS domain S-box-containing protein
LAFLRFARDQAERLSSKRFPPPKAMTERAETTIRFERFFEASPDLLAVLDFDGRFVFTNRAYLDLLGYPAQTLAGQPLVALAHPDDLERLRAALSSLPEIMSTRLEARLRHLDRSHRTLHPIAAPQA